MTTELVHLPEKECDSVSLRIRSQNKLLLISPTFMTAEERKMTTTKKTTSLW